MQGWSLPLRADFFTVTKHFSLLRYGINWDHEMLYSAGHWAEFSTLGPFLLLAEKVDKLKWHIPFPQKYILFAF
jgi:hypothetical protein